MLKVDVSRETEGHRWGRVIVSSGPAGLCLCPGDVDGAGAASGDHQHALHRSGVGHSVGDCPISSGLCRHHCGSPSRRHDPVPSSCGPGDRPGVVLGGGLNQCGGLGPGDGVAQRPGGGAGVGDALGHRAEASHHRGPCDIQSLCRDDLGHRLAGDGGVDHLGAGSSPSHGHGWGLVRAGPSDRGPDDRGPIHRSCGSWSLDRGLDHRSLGHRSGDRGRLERYGIGDCYICSPGDSGRPEHAGNGRPEDCACPGDRSADGG